MGRFHVKLPGSVVVACLLAAATGCTREPASNASAPTEASGSGKNSSGETSPRVAAEDLLKQLGAGKLAAKQFTPAFLNAIAPPRNDNERKTGYSESTATDWIERWNGTKFVVGDETSLADGIVLRGRAESTNRRDAFTARMIKVDGNYQIDWLHRSERMGAEIPATTPELAPAQDAVRNFLDVMLGGDLRQVHVLMTPAWRKAIAPPTPADERDGFDYSPGFLTQQTKAWKSRYVTYRLPTGKIAGSSAAFTAELDSGDSSDTYTLKAVRDAKTGWWLIESFSEN